MKYSVLAATIFAAATINLWGAEPAGYYSSCEGLSGARLLSALCDKVGSHTVVSYDGLWNLYNTSDVLPNGKLWDMYSTKEWTPGTARCGNYSKVGDCHNREHSFPKSWFDDARPMYSDAFHLYPTDGKVNGQRSNYPYGECAGGTTLPSNGSIRALGKLGTSTFAGYSGKVFEPDDQYKGDFARSYFYMAAAYNDRIASWHSDMLAGNAYPAFSNWALNLLLKWSRQDPVSQKELDRQEAVYAAQRNRNPFIDHPELVEYIWGDKQSQAWSANASADPAILVPVAGSTVDLGNVGVGVARTMAVTVKGAALTQAVSTTVSGAGYAVAPNSLPANSVCSTDGAQLQIILTAASAGSKTGTLTLTSGNVTTSVNLKAVAYDGLPASAPTDITDCSFVAHWTNIGGADADKCYVLTVRDAAGNVVDTYPRSVLAADEAALVDELEASTDYTYTISRPDGLTSNVIAVRTADPLPSVQILYPDGELVLIAVPGEPSEAAELMLDTENIAGNVSLTVKAPFELSSDKNNWAQTLTVDAREDRFYVRVNAVEAGDYESAITATAGDYTTDDAVVKARVKAPGATFVEDFEPYDSARDNTYNTHQYEGTAANWNFVNAGIWSSDVAYSGDCAARFGKNTDSSISTADAKDYGVGVVSFYARPYGSDGDADIEVQTSTDHGTTWTTAGTVKVTGNAYAQYTVTANVGGKAMLRLQQTTGKRVLVDDLAVTDVAGVVDILGSPDDYNAWTAYCLGHQLVIEATEAIDVAVHGVDGITYVRQTLAAGTHAFNVPQSLYVIAVSGATRSVLVK